MISNSKIIMVEGMWLITKMGVGKVKRRLNRLLRLCWSLYITRYLQHFPKVINSINGLTSCPRLTTVYESNDIR